ncbi:hypothetical protein WDZ92_22985, partial [Nostoc sp. NIES-2111]
YFQHQVERKTTLSDFAQVKNDYLGYILYLLKKTQNFLNLNLHKLANLSQNFIGLNSRTRQRLCHTTNLVKVI